MEKQIIAYYEVFKHSSGKWTFVHPSSKHKGGVILDLYPTRDKARKLSKLWEATGIKPKTI